MKYIERKTKRIFDIVVALFCIVVFSPLYLICYIAIIIDDGHPALFKQERIGYKGKEFKIYKFRTMKVNAEESGPKLYSANDDRLMRIGSFLRSHHLDELPQMWNVLKGDMSFIGPRPERKYFIDKIMEHDPRYPMLYQLRPGITSYATLYNGYTDTMEKMLERLRLDLDYCRNRTMWTDIKIIYLTTVSILTGKKF